LSRKFKIIRNYWENDQILYRKANIEINPGLTVLVGCNGSGKTTLIHQLKGLLDKEKITYTSFCKIFLMVERMHEAGLVIQEIFHF